MDLKPEIFISIASYRDPELIPTLLDLIEKATTAQLNITVCWQDEGDLSPFMKAGMVLNETSVQATHDLFHFSYSGVSVRVISVHYYFSQGACWARSLCESQYQNEHYFLQIDSHCRFPEGWDNDMITMLEQLKKESGKPVISSYPPGYAPETEPKRADYVSRLVFRGFSNEGILQLTSTPVQASAPLRGSYLAAGFIFAEGEFVSDVPNDPTIFFEGEEIAMTARAFTHGYDVYYPHKILLWHFYGRKNNNKVWSDHNNEAKENGSINQVWWERDKKSKKRVRALLGMEEESTAGRYSLGNIRTLEDFEYAIGVDFSKRQVVPEVLQGPRKAFFANHNCSRSDWKKKLVSVYTRELNLTRSETDFIRKEISWLFIGIYTEQNDLLESLRFSEDQINKVIDKAGKNKPCVTLKFTTKTSLTPHTIRVCPYLSQGWGFIREERW